MEITAANTVDLRKVPPAAWDDINRTMLPDMLRLRAQDTKYQEKFRKWKEARKAAS